MNTRRKSKESKANYEELKVILDIWEIVVNCENLSNEIKEYEILQIIDLGALEGKKKEFFDFLEKRKYYEDKKETVAEELVKTNHELDALLQRIPFKRKVMARILAWESKNVNWMGNSFLGKCNYFLKIFGAVYFRLLLLSYR